MKEVYQLDKQELAEQYGTAEGLTESRAAEQYKKYGANAWEETEKKHVLRVFTEQFADLLVLLLAAAAVVSFLSGNTESTVVILAVLLLNAILGTIQYEKAEQSLDALKKLSTPKARVLRDGKKREIPSEQVVPGEVLLLEAGDLVTADGRILESHSLQVNESSLTGESANVEKREETFSEVRALGDRSNMVYSGSLVTYGRAAVLVTATGMHTEMGKIAALMNLTKRRKTPLQVSLDEFSKKLAFLILIICAVVFGLRLWQREPLLDSLMFSVALAVAAIPEALSSIVTIVQAMGTRKMAEDHAIMKELKAVESLGCVSVICSDKTGTLTQNKMTVREVYLDGACLLPEKMDLTQQLHRYFLYAAILNNDAVMTEAAALGDPTETCLLAMARKAGLHRAGITEEDIRSLMPRLSELPFDSDRKRMSTKYLVHGVPMLFTKGAVDVLLDRTTQIAGKTGNRPITEEDREQILAQNRAFSERGLRVLAFAYRECDGEEALSEEQEQALTFLGLVSMIDPPREESAAAVAEAIRAGIKPVMITGDHKVTAVAIAAQLGICQTEEEALTGQELDCLSEEELAERLEQISVYARVSPENKIRIVEAWQKKGRIVAMTGDGVNDAPALKKADIGIAMGITGTEVSKDAAAMILTDDNFATIIKAVCNGRNVYRNIRNAIQFLLSGNTAAILVVLFCSIFALDTPFEAVHLLFINLVTDSLPALAIGMEPTDTRLMKQPPRDPKEGLLTGRFLIRLLGYGALIAVVTQLAYASGHQVSPQTASTMAFATLTLARLFHGFNCRSEASLFQIGFRSNLWSVGAFAAGTLLLAAVLFVPGVRGLFSAAPLTAAQTGSMVLLAALPTLVIQLVRRRRKHE